MYVDDEPNNLTAFKASLRKYFDIYTAASAEEGLKVLDSEEIHVLITDQYLPGISGIEFLESVMKSHPEPVRVLLTGYAVLEDLIKAVNKTQIYAYINKPWETEEVIEVIEAGYKVYTKRKQQSNLIINLQRTNEQLEFMLRERLIS